MAKVEKENPESPKIHVSHPHKKTGSIGRIKKAQIIRKIVVDPGSYRSSSGLGGIGGGIGGDGLNVNDPFFKSIIRKNIGDDPDVKDPIEDEDDDDVVFGSEDEFLDENKDLRYKLHVISQKGVAL
jgi:hypothetical protein